MDQGYELLKAARRSLYLAASLALGMMAIPPAAWAGGGVNDEPDHTHDDEGPGYFGFVKDARGTKVPGAKVTVKIKNGLSYVVQANATGMYKVPGIGKQIHPNDVAISCAKDGYRQLMVFRRPLSKVLPKAIETECRLKHE